MALGRVLDLKAVADAVIEAHAVIEVHGTPEMKAMIKLLMFKVGKEIVKYSIISKKNTTQLETASIIDKIVPINHK